MQHWVHEYYQNCSNYDVGLTPDPFNDKVKYGKMLTRGKFENFSLKIGN